MQIFDKNNFWYLNLSKDLERSELNLNSEDKENFINLLNDSIKSLQENIYFPARVNRILDEIEFQSIELDKLFRNYLEIAFNEDDYLSNFPNHEYYEYSPELESFINALHCFIDKYNDRVAKEEQPVTIHSQYYIDDVIEKIKDQPYNEKIKYILNIQNEFKKFKEKLSFEDILHNAYQDNFIKLCDREIELIEKIEKLENQNQDDISNEGVNKAMLARSFFAIISTLAGSQENTSDIARLLFYITYGKEANNKSEFQHFLNHMSSVNKVVSDKRQLIEKQTIEKYLKSFNINKNKK